MISPCIREAGAEVVIAGQKMPDSKHYLIDTLSSYNH